MLDRLAVRDVLGDRPLLPELGEARADPQQLLDQPVQALVVRVPAGGAVQVADPTLLHPRDLLGGAHDRRLLAGEVAAQDVLAAVAEQRSGERVHRDHLPRGVGDQDGNLAEAVQDALHAGRDPAIDRARAGRGLTGDAVQVRALVLAQTQRAGERREHARRRRARPSLLEAGEIVDREAGELRDLLAAQPGCAAAARGAQPGVRGAEPVAPGAQAAAELVHPS